MQPGEKMDDFRERKPLFALALSFLLTGMGQVYNGKPRKGILFLAASIVLPFLLFELSVVGPGRTPVIFLALSLAASLGIFIWAALDAWKQAKRSGKNYRPKVYNNLFVYILLVVGLDLLVSGGIVGLRKLEFLAVPFRMATGSMAPTILAGDLVLADGRMDHASRNLGLRKGELAVFKLPGNKKRRVVKRIIGLPGDEIEMRGMELFVNGIKSTSQETPSPKGGEAESEGRKTIAFYEKSDSGVYRVSYFEGTARDDFKISVPEGFCFVLGDNRDNSADSRHWGSIALGDIIARARIVYFSRNPEGGVRRDRIGKLLENTKSIKSGSGPN